MNRVLLYLLIFLTGAAGLVYQVVWQQYLARILGSEHAATAIVLAIFLGGLAVGYLISGNLSRRVASPLTTYGLLEAIIGAWALAFPLLFRAVDTLTARWSFAPPWALGFQGSLTAFALIGLPTLCMGGTVPLLTRGLSASIEESTTIHARVYAVNTLGAFLGALAAGFVLVPWLGLPGTLRFAAVLNFAAAFYFFVRGRTLKSPRVIPSEPVAEERRYPAPVLYSVAFLSGAYVMTLENVLIRTTSLSLGASTSSFALIVGVFVLCIGVGSLLVGAASRFSARALIWNQVLVTSALLAVFLTLDKWPYAAHVLRVAFQNNIAGFWWHKLAVILTLTLLLMVPIALAGATLPLAFHELRRDLARVGWSSGLLFAWNLAGAVAGSLIGGWLLYTWLDNGRVFLCAVLLAALSASVAAGKQSWRLIAAAVLLFLATIGFVIFRPLYDPHRFALGTFRVHAPLAETWLGARAFYQARMKMLRILDYRDGPAATVAVVESDMPRFRISPEGLPELIPAGEGQAETARAILVNGKSDSNTRSDRETLRLLADLGALFADKRERALLIGLGTGVSAGELALQPEWKKIAVAEVAPEVAAVLPLFSEATHRVQDDPRFDLRLGDAFRILRRSTEEWDVIASEPSNFWVRGTAQLFSQEFYRIVKARLSEGGVFVQWMQKYAVDEEILRRVGATLRSEFEHVTVFRGMQFDYLFVVTPRALGEADFARAAARMQTNAKLQESLGEIGIVTVADLRARQVRFPFLERDAARIETLDRPRLHDLAGKTAFFLDSNQEMRFTPPGPVRVSDPSLAR